MKKKIIAIIVACVLLAGIVSLIAMELGGQKSSLSATANVLPPSVLNQEQVITSNTNTSDDATDLPTKVPNSANTIDGIDGICP